MDHIIFSSTDLQAGPVVSSRVRCFCICLPLYLLTHVITYLSMSHVRLLPVGEHDIAICSPAAGG
jgi:hypothetical protein